MSLIDEIKIKSFSEAQEILKAAGSEDIFEKAHKDGDLHPNGKWVWVSSAAGGKGDWRTLNGRTHKKHQAANSAGGRSGSAVSTTTGGKSSSVKTTFQKYFSINNSKFTDPKKMSVSKTPQGNWSLSYEGKRISTVAPLTDADKKELESAGVTFDDTFKPKQKVKTNSETYSHDINGISVNVSKNKDGSYTLEANGKKVKSDDPSFFKDKLTPRVKKALAKELGIDVKNPAKQFDIKQIGDFISSIKTTHGDVSFIPKNGAIYLGKRRDYIGDCDEEEKTIELRQNALSNVKRDREAIKEISSALKEKFGFVSKTIYESNLRHGLKKAYMKIVLKPSE